MPSPVIRAATGDDAEAIHAGLVVMARDIGGPLEVVSTPQVLRRHGLRPGGAFEGLVAEIDGSFAGFCLHFPTFSTWYGEPGLYVQDLYVDARFRGAGVGAALIRHAARQARARGATHLRLAVDAGNDGAQRFYDRIGLAPYEADRIHAAYGDAFTALCEETTR